MPDALLDEMDHALKENADADRHAFVTILARSHNPEPGDGEALASLLRPLGITVDQVRQLKKRVLEYIATAGQSADLKRRAQIQREETTRDAQFSADAQKRIDAIKGEIWLSNNRARAAIGDTYEAQGAAALAERFLRDEPDIAKAIGPIAPTAIPHPRERKRPIPSGPGMTPAFQTGAAKVDLDNPTPPPSFKTGSAV